MRIRLGALLLDLERPTKTLRRTPDWLIEPEETCDLEGHLDGVIFSCGKVAIDGTSSNWSLSWDRTAS